MSHGQTLTQVIVLPGIIPIVLEKTHCYITQTGSIPIFLRSNMQLYM